MRTTASRGTKRGWAAANLAAALIAAALLAACGGEQPSTPTKRTLVPSPTATAALILTPTPASTVPPAKDTATSSGQGIFQSNCAVCHGADGEGQPDWHIKKPDGVLPAPPLNGDGHTWHHGDGTLYTYVSRGRKGFRVPRHPLLQERHACVRRGPVPRRHHRRD